MKANINGRNHKGETKMSVKYIIDNTYSKRDTNGNVYWTTKITRLSDGAVLEGISDFESASAHYLHKAGAIEFGQNQIHETNRMLPIREFNRLTKKMGFIHQDIVERWVNHE